MSLNAPPINMFFTNKDLVMIVSAAILALFVLPYLIVANEGVQAR